MFCMFFPWSLLPFWDITYAKKHIFPRASSGDLLLDEKQKKPFVSLSDQVTIIPNALTTASLAQADKALNGPDSNLFCRDTGSIRGRSIFFPFCSFTSFKNQDIYLKKLRIKLESGEIFNRGYCDVKHNTWISIERQSKEKWYITALSINILSIVFKYLVACLVVDRHHKALITRKSPACFKEAKRVL